MLSPFKLSLAVLFMKNNVALIFVTVTLTSHIYPSTQYEGTFEDYLEMLIQFGYVMLFSSAFPLAAMCSFLNNLIEIRSDAFKLCFVHQRPFPQRVGSIGVWQVNEHGLSLAMTFNNCIREEFQRLTYSYNWYMSKILLVLVGSRNTALSPFSSDNFWLYFY